MVVVALKVYLRMMQKIKCYRNRFPLTMRRHRRWTIGKTLLEEDWKLYKIDVKLRDIYGTKKFLVYCNAKDKALHEQRRITCPGCGEKYNGKTERYLMTCRMNMEQETLSPHSNIFQNAKCLKKHVVRLLFL